jgi:hypothetical protein
MSDTHNELPELTAKPRLRKPRKFTTALGPLETCHKVFSNGQRDLIIERIDADRIVYRLKGLPGFYALPHNTIWSRANGIEAGFDTGPRTTKRVTRGKVS